MHFLFYMIAGFDMIACSCIYTERMYRKQSQDRRNLIQEKGKDIFFEPVDISLHYSSKNN